MEYRKRRKKRNAPAEGSFQPLIRALILIIIFGAALWLIFGTKAGERIKSGWAMSLIDSCRAGSKPTATPSPLVMPEDTTSPAPTAAPTGETCEVKLPSIEIHMVEMGIYSDSALCSSKAAELKSMGAAGYVFNDGGSLRLIASAYSDKASAENVIERLKSEGYECSLHTVSSNGVELIITAPGERLLPIRTAFAAAAETITALDELAIDFDLNSRSTEYGLNVLNEIKTNLATASASIAPQAEQNAMLAILNRYYADLLIISAPDETASASRTAFASYIKALRVEAALRYVMLLSEIGGAA